MGVYFGLLHQPGFIFCCLNESKTLMKFVCACMSDDVLNENQQVGRRMLQKNSESYILQTERERESHLKFGREGTHLQERG